MSYAQDLQYVIGLARDAGKVILDHYGNTRRLVKTHVAASQEAVTEADRASQRLIVAGLKRRFPGDGIVGEEDETGSGITVDVPNPDGRNWIIDPIDGTNNFVAGYGGFCVCIGLLERGMPVLGVVYDVTRDLAYCAARGEGAWLGNRRLNALDTPLNDSSLLMLTSNVLGADQRMPSYVIRWMSQTAWKVRIIGSAALEATMVGAGVAHAAITVNGKIWDAAAAAAIVLESGGRFTSLSGAEIFPFNLRNYQGAKVPFLAAAPKAHAELLDEIRRNP